MRSDLIYRALTYILNRYQLCQLASKTICKLHKPHTRLQDTTNEVLVRFHQTSPIAPSTAMRAGIFAKPLEARPSVSIAWLGSAYMSTLRVTALLCLLL
jgi:hypothetical protein